MRRTSFINRGALAREFFTKVCPWGTVNMQVSWSHTENCFWAALGNSKIKGTIYHYAIMLEKKFHISAAVKETTFQYLSSGFLLTLQ